MFFLSISTHARYFAFFFFFFNDTATTEIYTLSLHDALPILQGKFKGEQVRTFFVDVPEILPADRKSTRLNSSHQISSYAVFCLKTKNIEYNTPNNHQTHKHKSLQYVPTFPN